MLRIRGCCIRVHFVGVAGAPPCLALRCSSSFTPPGPLVAIHTPPMVLLSKGPGRPQLYRLRTGLVCGTARRHLTNNGFFRVSEEVREALHSKKPVVALETTIYTHGRIPIK
jgi:hypothetical protein